MNFSLVISFIFFSLYTNNHHHPYHQYASVCVGKFRCARCERTIKKNSVLIANVKI